MKKFLLSLISLLCLGKAVFSQDLPAPPTNIQILPSGSYVIAMDNTNQANGSGYFNLKSYGLVVYLLNYNFKLKWVITAGKTKDATDFSMDATQFKPTAGSTSTKNFKAGPFVLFAADTAGVSDAIDLYNNALTATNWVKVYQTNAAQTVDIRYDMTDFKPKGAILDDGGNEKIHEGYMIAASIPTVNYAIGNGTDLLTRCFTFASEPHNGNSGPIVDTAISRIRRFVLSGGNFLAQCAAVENYENSTFGRFHSTTGIVIVNKNLAATTAFRNPDLSYNQFEGSYVANQGGSVQDWQLKAGGVEINNMYHTCDGSTIKDTIGTAVAKLKSGLGGLVFYLGNHQFNSFNNYNQINGVRMYMNAFLTPAGIGGNCGIAGAALPVEFINLTATRSGSNVNLVWETAMESNNRGFGIQRVLSNGDFREIAFTPTQAKGGNSSNQLHYKYVDYNTEKEITQYRIRQVDFDGKFKYSPIRTVHGLNQQGKITIYPNPSLGNAKISITNLKEPSRVQLLDNSGRLIKSLMLNNTSSVELNGLQNGIYVLKIIGTVSGDTKIRQLTVLN